MLNLVVSWFIGFGMCERLHDHRNPRTSEVPAEFLGFTLLLWILALTAAWVELSFNRPMMRTHFIVPLLVGPMLSATAQFYPEAQACWHSVDDDGGPPVSPP